MIKAVLFDLDGTLYDRDVLAATLFENQFSVFQGELNGISRALKEVLALATS